MIFSLLQQPALLRRYFPLQYSCVLSCNCSVASYDVVDVTGSTCFLEHLCWSASCNAETLVIRVWQLSHVWTDSFVLVAAYLTSAAILPWPPC